MRKAMIISVIAAVLIAVLDLTYCGSVEPDAVYPMTNQRITWMHEKNP